MEVNGVEITQETIYATREHFLEIDRRCLEEVRTGRLTVNDLAGYISWVEGMIERMASGADDRSLTFLQRAFWIQTGECPAMLPPWSR